MNNYNLFLSTYAQELHRLTYVDKHEDYEYLRSIGADISALADKIVKGLITGGANKDGAAIKAACKQLKIKHTYKDIKTFLEN